MKIDLNQKHIIMLVNLHICGCRAHIRGAHRTFHAHIHVWSCAQAASLLQCTSMCMWPYMHKLCEYIAKWTLSAPVCVPMSVTRNNCGCDDVLGQLTQNLNDACRHTFVAQSQYCLRYVCMRLYLCLCVAIFVDTIKIKTILSFDSD